MAQLPRGNPRSVPDPAGDLYDEMFRQERLKREREEAAANKLRSSIDAGLNAALFSPVQSRLKFSGPSQDRTMRIGDQTYREIDNGQANVLVPVYDPAETAKLADQRQAIDRAFFIARNPIGAVGYGVATLAGVSPQVRDQALIAGGVVDAAMLSASPRGAPVRRPTPAPQGQVAPPTWSRPNVRNRGVNAKGQAMGVDATLTVPMVGSGTKANRRIKPPGWSGNGRDHNEARGHLHAKDLGGLGDKPNLVTLTQNPTNTPHMRNFEQATVRRARAGEVFDYSVIPFYTEGVLPPSTILMSTFGGRRDPSVRVIRNPAGRPK